MKKQRIIKPFFTGLKIIPVKPDQFSAVIGILPAGSEKGLQRFLLTVGKTEKLSFQPQRCR